MCLSVYALCRQITAAGISVNSSGNVYFYNGGLTDFSQDGKSVRPDDGSSPEPDPQPDPDPQPGTEVVVTGMPDCWAYTNGNEYFHPSSGMVNGTWEQNGGAAKANAIKAFYKKVFKTSSAPNDNCLYNLFGAAYAKGTGYEGRYHSGIDMYLSSNSRVEIYSAHTGVVTAIGGQYGIVAIYDDSKKVTYLYLHMDVSNTDAKLHETIYAGSFLGVQSNVGLSGSNNQHLHIEVRQERQTEPAGLPTVNTPLTSISPYDYL